ncbi:hypothetical protein TRFO_28515 [Tritrichomonas foetus]|uniref:Intimal thickness related receptor IRP domain-containing protein n=1 Tax=Tritrichomonas foetus TaxID=1144522 RepID=A0A1J4K2U5_9EUKA|nr:hypothetical protein TRFO_28515 [Tritrichomonas foetus]|eukprot:OHT04068.1 hypothetical protein TRFO_28515 [Tritrichomonas foetus]
MRVSQNFNIHLSILLNIKTMLFSILFAFCYKKSVTIAFQYDSTTFHQFGLLAGGVYNFSINLDHSDLESIRLLMLVFNSEQYRQYFRDRYRGSIPLENCTYQHESIQMEEIELINGQTKFVTNQVSEKNVYSFVLQHCDNLEAKKTDTYQAELVLVNPNNQHLDYREIPSLTTLPIMITMFLLVVLGFSILVIMKKRYAHLIHYFIITCGIIYIFSLIFDYLGFNHMQKSDSHSYYDMFQIICHYFYMSLLFSIIILASAGWYLMSTRVSKKLLVSSIVTVFIFFAAVFIQQYSNLSIWSILVLIIEFTSIVGVFVIFVKNVKSTRRRIKAHLFAIQRQGIKITSTPIYKKYQIFFHFLIIILTYVFSDILVSLIMIIVSTDTWIVSIFGNILQMFIIGSLMIIYRPHEIVNEKPVQDDFESGTAVQSGAVTLEDLKTLSFNKSGIEWDETTKLVPEPIILDEVNMDQRPLTSLQDQNYDSVNQKLLQ